MDIQIIVHVCNCQAFKMMYCCNYTLFMSEYSTFKYSTRFERFDHSCITGTQ